MEAWLRDDDGRMLAVYSMGKLRIGPGVDRDKVLLLVTKLFQEAMNAGAGQFVYSGGYRYFEQQGGAGVN
jgi:hypothetical protein